MDPIQVQLGQPRSGVPAQARRPDQALSMQLRHVWSRQYRHSQMNQNGPLWQKWHVHWISVMSLWIMTKEWAQWLLAASAILTAVSLLFSSTQVPGVERRWTPSQGRACSLVCCRGASKGKKAPSLWLC
jgi:hypothetical protein